MKKRTLIYSSSLHFVIITLLIVITLQSKKSTPVQPYEIELQSIHVHEYHPPTQSKTEDDAPTTRPTKTTDQPLVPSTPRGSQNSGTQEQSAISMYLAKVLPLITQQRFYPRASLLNEESGVVQVKIQISSSGHIQNSEIKLSSGFTHLDAAALKTIRSIANLPPPPPELPSPLVLTVPIKYELNPDHEH